MKRDQDNIDPIFEDCLDLLVGRGETLEKVLARYPDLNPVLRPKLEAVLWLHQSAEQFSPRPGFIHASHQRLLAQIQEEGEAAASPTGDGFTRRSRPRRGFALAFALIVFLMIFISSSWAAMASQSALPNDLLYPVKIGLEGASLLFATQDNRTAELSIEYAHRRLIEMQTLALENNYEYIPAAETSFASHVERSLQAVERVHAQDPAKARALASNLASTLQTQTGLIQVLASAVPPQTQFEFNQALRISQKGVATLQVMLVSDGGTPEPGATGTSNAALAGSPTYNSTVTSTVALAATLKASSTAALSPTPATGTSVLNPVPVTTSVPAAIEPSEPGETEATPEPSKTPRPTKTERPTLQLKPTNENRPPKASPKPTHENRSTKAPRD